MSFIKVGDMKINTNYVMSLQCNDKKCNIVINKTPDSLTGKYASRANSTETYTYLNNTEEYNQLKKVWYCL